MATKKYINLDNLSTFLTSLRETFSVLGHKHDISDITGYTVDAELSSTSVNPVQNKVIDAEFESVSQAMGALETAIDGKSDSTHNHDGDYLTKEDPSAIGSFSLNRKESTSIGTYSVAEGRNNTASGLASHAEGDGTTASAQATHAEGSGTTASSWYAHAEGWNTTASARAAHAEGNTTVAKGQQSHAEGFYTVAASTSQHVQGKHNIEDANDVYAHIVGNGSSDAKSNAHTLDWDGNAWYAGTIKVGGTSYEDASEVALKSDIPEMPDIPELPEIIPMSMGGTEATDGATGLANLFAAGDTVLSSYQYGAELPENAVTGQMFFQEATGTIADIGQDVAAAVRAVNLLGNSDFRDPFNKRGASSYSTSGYTIDRWRYTNSNGVLTINDGYINLSAASANSHWRQTLPKTLADDKTYTFAIRVRGSGSGFIGFYNSADLTGSVGGGYLEFTPTTDWTTVLCTISNTANADMVTIRCDAGASIDLEWAAVYEGEYTVETLPPYVSKEYYVELVACNDGAVSITKVWENASPTSAFAAQTLTIDLSQYDSVQIVYRMLSTQLYEVMYQAIKGSVLFANAVSGSSTNDWSRVTTINSDSIVFASGEQGSSSNINTVMIPYKIYGIKGVQ